MGVGLLGIWHYLSDLIGTDIISKRERERESTSRFRTEVKFIIIFSSVWPYVEIAYFLKVLRSSGDLFSRY